MTTKIILIKESAKTSLIRDAGTFITFSALIGTGIIANSSAMQWAGFLIGALWLLSKVNQTGKRNTYTISEARQLLDKLEAGND